MENKSTYDKPQQMADYGISEHDLHHCGGDINEEKEVGMTLDEAIQHAEEVAKSGCGQCARDHQQLADWLRELKTYRDNGKETTAV